ncbi:hypothetical protein [Flexivirga caeni]|uniref:hypothetical protein n=1 Tax=Flexivirga caeni TaxID=2294115 RepID=UPI0011CE58B9|nr:hypothetical protein [Flexivirga caeni]
MEDTPADRTPGEGAPGSAGARIQAAFALLTSAFQDARTDSAGLSKTELLDQAVTAQRVLDAAWAVQSARLAQAAAIEDVVTPDATSPEGVRVREIHHRIGAYQEEFIGCEVGPLLGWTSRQALDRVSEASEAIRRTPRLFTRGRVRGVGAGQAAVGPSGARASRARHRR